MPRFAANVSIMFTEIDFQDRFQAARGLLFQLLAAAVLDAFRSPASSLSSKELRSYINAITTNRGACRDPSKIV